MKLVSWNILAQSTIPDELQSALAWENRRPVIVKCLQNFNADFICLQEVELNTFESDFKELLTVYKFARHTVCMKGKYKRTNTFGNVTMWKTGQMTNMSQGSRSLHITLHLENGIEICISNVHFPAKGGLEGYLEKRKHLASCAAKWNVLDVIVAGDFNDGLSFQTSDGKPSGLYTDFTCLGFVIPDEELKEKQTCKSFRGNIFNIDHVLSRATVVATYIPQDFGVNSELPSDHIPVLYAVAFKQVD